MGVVARRQGAEAPARRWLFADVVFDERSLLLSVAGTPVKLERRPLEALLFLLQHAGEVVTKEELLDAVWPGRILSETSLAKCIGRVREVLGDEAQTLVKTVHGYGYRLAAEVRVELQRAVSLARFAFKPGDHPRGRPLWSLLRRLGAGGHGEAWLAQHDKTREQRVFKFAIDAASLTTLKREITLYRLLKDGLGSRARIVDLLDWNLEREPCFIECHYVAGGSLVDWAERQGGPGAIPLATRLDLVAQIADALAAVHALGVLHKDLKPSNILIEETEGAAPRIRLGDFGSGGVLDPKYLEQMGITRLGFTRAIMLEDSGSGTLLHRAPELLEGQPPTVKADIYALGVILYQLAAGEFLKSFSPGWERDFEDELLRECIADAAQGDPARRIGDAAALALRLRTLEQEREKRRIERDIRQKAEAAERAFAAAATSRAVADFLSKDLFATVGARPLREITVRELLDAASAKMADRFKDMPEAAAQIHAALGNAFWAIEASDKAEQHLEQALDLYERIEGRGSEATLAVAAQLVKPKFLHGKLLEALPHYEGILAQGQNALGNKHPAILCLKRDLAQGFFLMGQWRRAAEEFRDILEGAKFASAVDNDLICNVERMRGFCLLHLGEFKIAAQVLLDNVAKKNSIAGVSSLSLAQAHRDRGRALVELEQFAEAETEMSKSLELIRPWVTDSNSLHVLSTVAGIGLLRLRQNRIQEAITTIEDVMRNTVGWKWSQETDPAPEQRTWLAEAYVDAGRLEDAEITMRRALAGSEKTFGIMHPFSQRARICLADIARLRQRPKEARDILAAVHIDTLSLGVDHPLMAEYRRAEGNIALEECRMEEAVLALREALRIFEFRYEGGHAFVRRAQAELAGAMAGAAGQT